MLTLSLKISERGTAHVEVCFNKRPFVHGDVHRGVLRRIFILGPFITENGYVVGAAEIKKSNRRVSPRE